MQTLLETIGALEATRLRHLSDIHLTADGRHATAYLCFAPPRDCASTLARELLLVGLEEQLEALTASRLVGQLQVAVLQHGDGDRRSTWWPRPMPGQWPSGQPGAEPSPKQARSAPRRGR